MECARISIIIVAWFIPIFNIKPGCGDSQYRYKAAKMSSYIMMRTAILVRRRFYIETAHKYHDEKYISVL